MHCRPNHRSSWESLRSDEPTYRSVLSQFRDRNKGYDICRLLNSAWIQGRLSPLSQWCILHILPISTKFINFPPISAKLTFFCLIYFFAYPHFDHDELRHHTLHILDASAWIVVCGHCIITLLSVGWSPWVGAMKTWQNVTWVGGLSWPNKWETLGNVLNFPPAKCLDLHMMWAPWPIASWMLKGCYNQGLMVYACILT